MSKLVKVTINDESFYATVAQRDALEVLTSTNGGGMAVIHDYISESRRVSPETADISFISRFSYTKLLKRKLAHLEATTLDTIREECLKVTKLRDLDEATLSSTFETRKAYLIASINKTLEGDRSDARREAHDRNYTKVAEGLRVHYKTVKDSDNVAQPVTLDGFPIVETIHIAAIQISKRVKVPGEYKVVNSGAPVLIGNIMEKSYPKSTKYKEFSLAEGKFSSLTIGGETMLDEDFKGIF